MYHNFFHDVWGEHNGRCGGIIERGWGYRSICCLEFSKIMENIIFQHFNTAGQSLWKGSLISKPKSKARQNLIQIFHIQLSLLAFHRKLMLLYSWMITRHLYENFICSEFLRLVWSGYILGEKEVWDKGTWGVGGGLQFIIWMVYCLMSIRVNKKIHKIDVFTWHSGGPASMSISGINSVKATGVERQNCPLGRFPRILSQLPRGLWNLTSDFPKANPRP